MPAFIADLLAAFPPEWQVVIVATFKVVVVLLSIVVAVAMLTLAERKVIGYMQLRRGPNRVSFFGLPILRGLAQPFADVIKLLLKEIIVPGRSSRFLFLLAPLIVLVPAMAVWAVMPLSPDVRDRGHRCRAPVRARAHVDGRLRRDPRGLGQQLAVRLPRRHALRRADGRLRDRRWASRSSAC